MASPKALVSAFAATLPRVRDAIAALRITGPRDHAGWIAGRKIPVEDPPVHLWVTDESDLASAYFAAIDFVRGRTGRFDSFFIASDETGQEVNLSKANQLLRWAPKAHLLSPD